MSKFCFLPGGTNDVFLSAYGRGASLFTGVYDNTEVFFKIGQAVLGGIK